MDVYETYVYTPSQAVTFGSDNPYPRNPDERSARHLFKGRNCGNRELEDAAFCRKCSSVDRAFAVVTSVRRMSEVCSSPRRQSPSPRLFTKENIRSDSYIGPKTAMGSRAIDRPWQTSGSSSDSSHSSGQSRVSSRSRSSRSREWTRTSGEHGCSSWKN